MQKTKNVTVGTPEKTFLLRELSVRVIWDLVNNKEKDSMAKMQDLLRLACPDLTPEVLIDLYPSEIEELWAGFEEVNSAFLGVARLMGLDKAIIQVVREAVLQVVTSTGSIVQSAILSKMATGQ